jgi:hypothetical protein
LRELDLFYGLFLDRLWFAVEIGELHGSVVPIDCTFDQKFSRKTNIASKQKGVATKLNTADHFDELYSLSLARNALAHHAGTVRSATDCNSIDRDSLTVKWRAFDVLVSRDGQEQVVHQAPFDT